MLLGKPGRNRFILRLPYAGESCQLKGKRVRKCAYTTLDNAKNTLKWREYEMNRSRRQWGTTEFECEDILAESKHGSVFSFIKPLNSTELC